MEQSISTLSIVCAALSLAAAVGLPIALTIWCARRRKGMLRAVLIGALCFVLGALVLEQLLHLLMMTLVPNLQQMPFLFTVYTALAAGFFEETARLVGLRFLCKKDPDAMTGFAYGVGHGGIEALVIGIVGLSGNLATLLEEPQAAFYAWLSEHESDWREQVGDGDVVLVCDLGGGTSDFSLIAVADVAGELTLQRLAVGDHTLLGGDNMDLALAVKVAARLKAEKGLQLNTRQFISLVHGCRRAKEALSGGGKVKDQSLAILGTGSGLVAGTITTKLSYAELKDTILEGFFPACELTATPQTARRSGMRSFALDYASDPAFTRHLAQFLNRHSFRDGDGHALLPRFVLFNGGVTKSALFRSRIVESLDGWRGPDGGQTVVFTQRAGDLSVALGAAWYAHVRQHGGVRIKAGSPRSYYIGVESPQPAIPGLPAPLDALCVVPFGMEEGTQADIEMRGLALLVGEPTEFRFFSSTTRPDDALGERLPALDSEDLTELSPLAVTLAPSSEGAGGSLVPVTLRTVLTDIGTLELWCQEAREGGQSWKLEFTVRGDE